MKLKAIVNLIFSKEWVLVTDNDMLAQVRQVAYSPYIRNIADEAIAFQDKEKMRFENKTELDTEINYMVDVVQVIDGKRYDTSKSTLLMEIDFIVPSNKRFLYITGTGLCFVCSYSSDGHWQKIKPTPTEDAIQYLEKKQRFDLLEKYFDYKIKEA